MMINLTQISLDFSQQAVDILPGVTSESAANPSIGFGNFLSAILSAVMVVGALLVLLALITGAINWITASGDKAKLEAARNRITQAIIGIIVLSATLALFALLQQFLGIQVIRLPGASPTGPKVQPNSNIPSQGTINSPGSTNQPSSNQNNSLENIENQLTP